MMSCEIQNKKWPVELKHELDKYIVGQNKYKETIAMSIYRHVKSGYVAPVLIKGPTGSGKTFLFQCLKKSKLLPANYTCMMTNVSRLTEEGIKGPDIEDIFVEYKSLCQNEKNMLYRGIIYIDEIDKIISSSVVNTAEGSIDRNATIQHQLMQILDGGKMAGVPTDNILFVFGGAFYKLDEMGEKKTGHRAVGFGKSAENECVVKTDTIRERMIELGFQREFLGRIGQIVELEELSKNELLTILMHPTRGLLSKIQKEYEADGIKIYFEPEAIDLIIESVVREKLGARSVRNIVEKLLSGAWYHCIDGEYDKIVINRDSVLTGKINYKKQRTVDIA